MKTTRTRVAIIDIDGTIADCSHRLKHIEGEEKDWDTFYRLAHYDTPMKDHIAFIKRYLKKNKLMPVFSTGRNEKIEKDTEEFILKYKIETSSFWSRFAGCGPWEFLDYRITSRKKDDTRPASEVKRDMLHEHLRNYSVEAVFEDNFDCLKMYKDELQHYPCDMFYPVDQQPEDIPFHTAPFRCFHSGRNTE